jgi:transcriptional regulator with XRE-family HTH domain
MELKEVIGQNVKRLVEDSPLKAKQISKLIGLKHPASLSKIQSGKYSYPKWETLLKLSKLLGVPFCEFFKGYKDK